MREEFSVLTACQNHKTARNTILHRTTIHRTTGSTEPQPPRTTASTEPRAPQNHSLQRTTGSTEPQPPQNHGLHRTTASTEPRAPQNHGLHRTTALYNKSSHKEICPVTRSSPSSWGHSYYVLLTVAKDYCFKYLK